LRTDFQPLTTIEDSLVVTTRTKDTGNTFLKTSAISYHPEWGWFLYTFTNNTAEYHRSYQTDLVKNRWYTVNLTVWNDTVSATIHRVDDGTLVWSIHNKTTERSVGGNTVALANKNSDSLYDNFQVFDLTATENVPPEWHTISSATLLVLIILVDGVVVVVVLMASRRRS
jgi:hypothetical protein